MFQLYLRIIKLNGSLDKPWLLMPLFLMFPLSLIPTLMIHWNYLKKGAGTPVYDKWMYIPIIFYVLYNIFLEYLDSDFDMLFRLCGLFISILIPYFIRESNNCKELKLNQYANILSNSALVLGISYMCLPIVEILGYVPIVGLFFSLLGMIRDIPMIGETLLWSIFYIPTYIIINMFNYKNGIQLYCGRKNHYILGIIGVILSISGYYLDDYMYYG